MNNEKKRTSNKINKQVYPPINLNKKELDQYKNTFGKQVVKAYKCPEGSTVLEFENGTRKCAANISANIKCKIDICLVTDVSLEQENV